MAYIAYSFIGFEASASIAEEVQESRKVLPKAVVLSLAVGGVLVIVACLGIVLAIPDMSAAVAGKDTNPIATTLEHSYGSGAGRTLLIALAIGFTSSMIAVQTAVTRAIWASARDQLLPGTRLLGRLSGREHLPRYAIGLTVIIAGALIFAGASKVFALLVSFSAFGFILSYYMPIVALAWKQWRGQSPTADGWGARWIPLITSIAVVWLSAEIVNLLWPRAVNSEWYLNWGAIIMTGVLGRARRADLPAVLPAGLARDAGPADRRAGGRDVRGRPVTPVALVSGAASGIGRACASVMREHGWQTAGIDLNASDTDLSLRADVSDRSLVAAAVDQVVERFGRIDLLVTAAGDYEEGIDVADITVAQWDRMLGVILGGTVNCCAAVLPHMLSRDQGTIVAISSELALGGSATDLHYVAAKGAVLGLIKSLAMEVAQTAIRVNAVAPGPTDTPLLAADSLWREPTYLSTLPLGRAGQAVRDRFRRVLPSYRGVHVLRRGAVAERRGGDLMLSGVALITGAAQGLGHATALRLAADGFTVAVNDLADDGRLTDLAERTGGLAFVADISDPVAGPAMVRAVADRLGPVQVLVANAAAMAMSPFLESKPDSGGIRSTSTSPGTSGSSRRSSRECASLVTAGSSSSARAGASSATPTPPPTPRPRRG